MNHWTIGKRITFVVGILCLLLAATGGLVWNSLGTIRRDAASIEADVMPGTIASSKIVSLNLKNYSLVQAYARASASDRPAVKARLTELSQQVTDMLAAYEKTIFADEDRKLFAAVTAARNAYVEERAKYYRLVEADKVPEAVKLLDTTLPPLLEAYVTATDRLFDYNAQGGDRVSKSIVDNAHGTTSLVVIITLAALAIGGVVSFFIIRRTNGALKEIAAQLTAGAEQTASASTEVSSTSQSLAEGASEQAASLEETSASLEEISSMTKRNAESAGQAKALAGETRAAAENGAASMGEMKSAMDAIKESSANIAKIVKTIDEIAFQTNILALNAAVEAARAGEAGAGFAVVAEEVRSLAQRSASAAKETAALIDESVVRSGRGVDISGQVAQSFAHILDKARQVDTLVGEIATASNEQHQGIGQVTTAVSQMDKVTQSNASGAEESAAASEELSAQAQVLHDTVRQLERLVGASRQGAAAVASQVSARERHVSPRVKSPALIKPLLPTEGLRRPAAVKVPQTEGNGHAADEHFR